MSKDQRDFLEKLRSTSITAAAEIMEGLQRLRDFHDEMVDDGSGAPPPRPRLGDHFYQLAKLELEHAASVMRLGSMQAEMVFDHVRQLARGARGGEPPLRVVELTQDKGHYIGYFDIRNPFDRSADVRFQLSALRDSNGGDQPRLNPVAHSRTRPIPAHATSRIDVALSGTVNEVLFGQIDVFLSAEVEKRVARRALKVQPDV